MKDKKLLHIISLTVIFIIFTMGKSLAQETLRVATYNIRNDNQGDQTKGNGWQQRLPTMVQLLRYQEFDVFGAQEVLHNQLINLLDSLPQYAHVGVGRDDGQTKGEYAPIFYNRDRFEVLSSGHFWLGEVTDRPTKGWDAALPRICTYAQLEDQKSGKKLWVFNLHLDHVGKLARENSCKLVLTKVKELTSNEPVMLMGDFNVDQNNAIYGILNKSGLVQDAYELAPLKYATNGTFNAFDPNLKTNSRIDHIFLTGHFQVSKYAVLTDTYRSIPKEVEEVKKGDFPKELSFTESTARLPSDHFPVVIHVTLQ